MENKKKIYKGLVIRTKMDKTIVVKKKLLIKHNKYGKFIKKIQIFFVHDEKNICVENDIVYFYLTKPISKKKHWMLLKVDKNDTN